MSIENKVVLITGASSGIGEASARLLASRGAKVVLGARRDDRLRQIAEGIEEDGGQAAWRKLDVTDPQQNKDFVAFAKERYGQVDVMFLNAGLMPSSPLSALKTDEWDRMVDVNLKGVLHGIAAALPEFTAQKSGQFITTSSVAGLKAYPNGAVYGATKWAVRELMEVLRMESAMEGTHIRTATIYPAAIQTELLNTITDKGAKEAMNQTYDSYQITPDRVASVVAFAIDQPEDTNVSEFTIGPTIQPW
ncbi:oxidoreductase [Bifidobacterium actinocoloniiforme DSM 22766]|uniref:Oxidoreductase n=1 Tax=Bifidobacterium actinocoloniiforme DSM 22766 TaxID=1437605 RepID=A0A086Z1S0_9BIFI|nr:SDR family oxidoreductase [Bifidobacterium actinocoloniiforme]AKV55581.1 oxidoreductase [Bifidobacterium actinocoloniiforme DSM 22766]KFI40470.1 oxidoreductase [Bifidobacterium actinocoloniiforme DSM 22766]